MDEELYDLLKHKRKDDAIKYIRNKYIQKNTRTMSKTKFERETKTYWILFN